MLVFQGLHVILFSFSLLDLIGPYLSSANNRPAILACIAKYTSTGPKPSARMTGNVFSPICAQPLQRPGRMHALSCPKNMVSRSGSRPPRARDARCKVRLPVHSRLISSISRSSQKPSSLSISTDSGILRGRFQLSSHPKYILRTWHWFDEGQRLLFEQDTQPLKNFTWAHGV